MKPPRFPQLPLPELPGLGLFPEGGWGPSPGRNMGMPVGAIIAFGGELLEESRKLAGGTTDLQHYGWRLCNGDTLRPAAYPDLFAAIGYIYGKAANEDFLLPDYRGQFLRTVDPKPAKVDKDLDKRTKADGTPGYSGVGSKQTSAIQQHEHWLNETESTETNGILASDAMLQPGGKTRSEGIAPGGPEISKYETRATNMSVYWLIKCRPDAVL